MALRLCWQGERIVGEDKDGNGNGVGVWDGDGVKVESGGIFLVLFLFASRILKMLKCHSACSLKSQSAPSIRLWQGQLLLPLALSVRIRVAGTGWSLCLNLCRAVILWGEGNFCWNVEIA